MKCIKNFETKDITRIYDEAASRSVKAGTHTYITKKEWKDNVRDLNKK